MGFSGLYTHNLCAISMVPFWGRCTTHFRTYFSGWIGMFTGYDLDFDHPWLYGFSSWAMFFFPPVSVVVLRIPSLGHDEVRLSGGPEGLQPHEPQGPSLGCGLRRHGRGEGFVLLFCCFFSFLLSGGKRGFEKGVGTQHVFCFFTGLGQSQKKP